MYKISVEDSFSAAHRLRGYKGKCEKMHGHNWRVRLSVSGTELDSKGLLLDFSGLKKMLGNILAALDHEDLSRVPPFNKINPSAENIARHIFDRAASALPSKKYPGLRIETVSVWESDKSRADYSAG
ncbi:MAG: 6-carboxytetrahydropterin synthase QueD [Elusimicrobia bacterium HGW-Elusimicrobia-1]|nr:MAG: 6-carboxytetrahydropterin synthase QueD [Elusimicrobia bacterium HGW-Elusimicrobia-1]